MLQDNEQLSQNNEMDQLFDQFLAANAENDDQYTADDEIITEEHDILNDLTDDETSTSLDDMLQTTDEQDNDTNKN